MRLEVRRFGREGEIINVIGIVESEEESVMLDLLSLGKPGTFADPEDEALARGTYEVRLADGYGDHYVMLKKTL